MKLTRIKGACRDDTCPTLYATDRGTFVVQGYVLNDTDVTLPEGEALVEVPAELLREVS
jgi:hypothetical protein